MTEKLLTKTEIKRAFKNMMNRYDDDELFVADIDMDHFQFDVSED